MFYRLHLIALVLTLTLVTGLQGGLPQTDSLLTAALQGSNDQPAMNVALESISLLTPVVEIGWTLHQGWQGRNNDNPFATDNSRQIAASIIVTDVLIMALKYTIRRERPPRNYQPRLWNTRITPSFPSGHAASSAAFAATVASRYPDLAPAAAAYTLVSAYSQVYVGNHYLGDVLAGAAIGGLVAWCLNNHAENHNENDVSGSVQLWTPPVCIRLSINKILETHKIHLSFSPSMF